MNSTACIGTINPTTKMMTPLYHMDPYLSTIKIGFPLIGIPMNILVAGTIIFTRQLRATQNIAWLGCSFANVSLLLCFLVEVAAAGEENSSFFLLLYQTIIGLPDAYQILYLLISWLDRKLFFTHTSFYKKYVTNLVILTVQFTCFILVTLLLKGRFLYQSLLTNSLNLNTLIEKEIGIVITSVLFMSAVLLYVPIQQLLEMRSYRKKQNECILENRAIDSIENKTAKAYFEKSDDSENNEETNILENRPKDSSNSLETNTRHKQSDSRVRDGKSHPDKGTSIKPQNQQTIFDQSELQSYYSIKTNIQAKFILITFPLIFLAVSLFCLLFNSIDKSLFTTCSTWFATTFYLHGVCMGFYTAIFNPICFVGNSHDLIELKQRCNPIGGIARTITRFENWIENPNTLPNTDAVANMV